MVWHGVMPSLFVLVALTSMTGTLVEATMSSNKLPLSYILADTAFLADEVSAIQDEGVNWEGRLQEYLWHIERSFLTGLRLEEDLPESVAYVDAEGVVTFEKASARTPRRNKRQLLTSPLAQLTKDPKGVSLLKNLSPRFNIPAKFPNDVVLFSRTEAGAPSGVQTGVQTWYAAALEADGENPQMALANALVLYKLTGNRFLEQTRVAVYGASALAVQDIDGWTYLVASERTAQHRDAPQKGSILYRLSRNGKKLVLVETLETINPSDLCFWEYLGSHYLAVASEYTNQSGVVSYSADTLVFKWQGEHLDILQRLPTSGARAVTAFTIGSTQYLAVANHVDSEGKTEIDSVIYRFDAARGQQGQFVVHQHLRTHAAVHVSYFSMNHSSGQDHFLAVANSYYQGADGTRNPATLSVIYRWTEGYFMPFQSFELVGISRWSPYLGPRGETVLFGATAYGVQAFQYDGWRFQPFDVPGGERVKSGSNITSLRSIVFESEGLIVIANKENDGTETNVLAMHFEGSSPLEGLYANMKQWCEREHALLQLNSASNLLDRVLKAPKVTDDVVVLNSVVFESNSTIKTVSASSIQTGNRVVDSTFINEVNSLATTLGERQRDLNSAKMTIDRALKKDAINVVEGRVVLHNASLSCPGGCRFGNAQVGILNNEPVDQLLNSTVRLDENINARLGLRFSNIVVPGNLVTRRVLGGEASLVSKVETKRLLGSLDVEELIVNVGLEVDGTIDDTRIAPDTVLLVDGDQTLPGFDRLTHWQVNKMIVHGRIGGMTVDLTRPELPPEVEPEGPPANIIVNNVQLAGLLGKVDIREVQRRALRTEGRQQVTGPLKFEVIDTNAAMSNVRVEDIVRVDSTATIPGALHFKEPVVADRVTVYNRLNHVAVAEDLSMDLLLNNGQAGPQRVTGSKWLRRLNVTDIGRVHGRVLGLVLPAEDEDLVRIVHDDITVEGDVTITGRVDIKGTVAATDIVEPGSGLTLHTVLRDAIPLHAPLPPNVVIEDLDVTSDLEVKMVNGVPTSSWIVNAPGANVYVSQPVKFTGGLEVTGSSTLRGKVNGVSLDVLDATSLKTSGDQVVYGQKTFDKVIATSASSHDTRLGSERWPELWRRRRVDTITVEEDLVVDGSLSLKRLTLAGTLDNLNLNATLADSVFSDSSTTVIDGLKTFVQTMHVDNLHVGPNVTGSDLSGVLAASSPKPGYVQEEITFALGPIAINNPLSVGKLGYHGTLDGVPDADWSAPWLEVDGDQVLTAPQTIVGNVDALSGVQIGTTANGVDLKRFAAQAARIDDPNLRLGQVTFEGPLVADGPVSAGSVDGVDLSDALLARGMLTQEVRGRLVLAGGLQTQGLEMSGALAGEDFDSLCQFANPPTTSLNVPQHLTVRGNVLMDSEPVLENINSESMKKLLNNTWLRDRSAIIYGQMEFADVQFTAAVNVRNRIDRVHLDAIAARYVSLSSDGTITTKLNVEGGVEVEGQLIGGPVDVGGQVGELNLADFPRSVLMDGPDQDVSAHMKFGIVHTNSDLRLDGTINGLDLAKDVVLIKETPELSLDHNRITAPKSILSASVGDLGLQEGVRVQGVDLHEWNRDAVRVAGDYIVTGAKTLREPQVVNGMFVDGLVSGVRVDADHLLLRHSDQMVVGPKTFRPAPLPGLGLHVQSLEVNGNINDVDMRDLLARQAYRTGDVDVLSPVTFSAPLRAGSAQLDALYHTVNVSDLIYRAQHPFLLDQYSAQHEALQRTAENVQRSLKAQGYYLNYYHTAVSLRTGVRAMLPLGKADEDSAYAIAVVREGAPGRDTFVEFFSWSANTIVKHPSLVPVALSGVVRMVAPAVFVGQNALYFETVESTGVHVGAVLAVMRDGRLGRAELVRDTVPSAWVAVTMIGGMSCMVRGSPGGVEGRDGFCVVLCYGSGMEDLVRQPLPVVRPMHAASLTVHGVPYVFVASGASEVSEGSVAVWRWDAGTLTLAQTLTIVNASALAAIEYRGVHYLATASSPLDDAPHHGMVHISRFANGRWSHWMSVEVEGPHALRFAVLPSNELVLYVATTCPTESLVALLYRGVAGFVRKASAAVPVDHVVEAEGVLSAFTTAHHQHLVAVSDGHQAALLEAAFKGSWESSERGARAAGRA